jgi:hypothetical protein
MEKNFPGIFRKHGGMLRGSVINTEPQSGRVNPEALFTRYLLLSCDVSWE